jgi:uncharacterized protein YjbI with pentapeptide repeats
MIESKTFERVDFTIKPLPRDEYDTCNFLNCNFYTAELSHITFRDCRFENCDFSLAKLKNTGLNNIQFVGCKLLGVLFSECNQFLLSVEFENCMLKLSVFNKLKLKKTNFKNCNLEETDFTETELTGSLFDNCEFRRAIFYKTKLEKSDFRTSINYSIDPENNNIRKAKFSISGVVGLLDKYDIDIQ